jgi:hypothetical protein
MALAVGARKGADAKQKRALMNPLGDSRSVEKAEHL